MSDSPHTTTRLGRAGQIARLNAVFSWFLQTSEADAPGVASTAESVRLKTASSNFATMLKQSLVVVASPATTEPSTKA